MNHQPYHLCQLMQLCMCIDVNSSQTIIQYYIVGSNELLSGSYFM